MGKAYSQDLRERVIAAVMEEGLSRRAAAARFRVSDASAVRWLQAWARGRRAPLRQGGDRRSRLPVHRTWLLELIARENDLTLAAVAERLFAAHGVRADAPMLSRFFTGQGISFKKKPVRQRTAPPRRRGGARAVARSAARSGAQPPDLPR